MYFLKLIEKYNHSINDPDVFYVHHGQYEFLQTMFDSVGKSFVNKTTEKNYGLFLEYLNIICNLSNLNSHMYFRYKDNYLEYLLTDLRKQNGGDSVILLINTINNIKCDRFITNLVDNEFLSVNPDMVYQTKPIKLLYNERN